MVVLQCSEVFVYALSLVLRCCCHKPENSRKTQIYKSETVKRGAYQFPITRICIPVQAPALNTSFTVRTKLRTDFREKLSVSRGQLSRIVIYAKVGY